MGRRQGVRLERRRGYDACDKRLASGMVGLMTVRSLVWELVSSDDFCILNSIYELSHELTINAFSFYESSWFVLSVNINHLHMTESISEKLASVLFPSGTRSLLCLRIFGKSRNSAKKLLIHCAVLRTVLLDDHG